MRTDLRGWKQGDPLDGRAEAVTLRSTESWFTSRGTCMALMYADYFLFLCLITTAGKYQGATLRIDPPRMAWELVHKDSGFSQWDKSELCSAQSLRGSPAEPSSHVPEQTLTL